MGNGETIPHNMGNGETFAGLWGEFAGLWGMGGEWGKLCRIMGKAWGMGKTLWDS